MDMTQTIINLAVKSALVASSGGSADELNKLIQQNKELVKPSFDRSLKGMNTEDEKNRGIYKFELYSTLRSITTFLNKDKAKLKQFSIVWGNELVSTFAPSASKKDFTQVDDATFKMLHILKKCEEYGSRNKFTTFTIPY